MRGRHADRGGIAVTVFKHTRVLRTSQENEIIMKGAVFSDAGFPMRGGNVG